MNFKDNSALESFPQLDLFGIAGTHQAYGIATSPEIDVALARAAPVFMGVSGGRDSMALAYRVTDHLNEIGHLGTRYLIHSDLGRVEWRDSLPVCERLATRLGVELIVVRRKAGDMMDRWKTRWANNVERYKNLQCVKLILPWSTPSTRFCTSELKGQVIASEIRKRYPKGDIVSAVGIRREESAPRSRMPIWKIDERTTRKSGDGHTWNAILSWTKQEVNAYIKSKGDHLHPAYTIYGSGRVSCCFCIMSALSDLVAAASCPDNEAIYREMVDLEIESTFSFQGNRWLGDVAPSLLDAATRSRLSEAKERAAAREGAEARLAEHLLFTKGWPTQMPTVEEADTIAAVRRAVAAAVGIDVQFTDGAEVVRRYAELMATARAKAAAGGFALEEV